MPERVAGLLDAYRLGDLASLLGLLVALVGFAATVWAAWRAKTAAEAAAEAANRTRDQLLSFQTTTDLSSVISKMEALKALHRAGNFPGLADRYSALAGDLMSIRSRNPSLSAKERAILQEVVLLFRGMEHEIDLSSQDGVDRFDVARLNRAISRAFDELTALLHDLERRAHGGDPGERID